MRYGFDYITSGSYAGDWSELYFPVDTTVTLTTTKGDSVTTTFTEGTSIVGTYVGINISSGGIIAYRRSDTEKFSAFTGVLDTYPATAAYSLRKLKNDYSGPAIRVRRASDNEEQDIYFVDNDLDTASLTSFCMGTNGFVTTWYDQQGSFNATQATAGNQPKIYDSSTGVVLENGKPALSQANAGNEFLLSSLSLSDFSIFTVAQTNYVATGITFWELNAGAADRQVLATDGSSFLYAEPGDVTNTLHTYTSLQFLNSMIRDGLTLDSFLNSSPSSNNTFNNLISNSPTSLYVGNDSTGGNAPDKIQELIIYNSDQSANRTAIESNINSYYSIYP